MVEWFTVKMYFYHDQKCCCCWSCRYALGCLWIQSCFGESINGFIGNPTTFLFYQGVKGGAAWPLANTIPLTLFSLFQLMFAIITPGLVVGAVAERIRFTSYILFIVLFQFISICTSCTLELASGRIPCLKWVHGILPVVLLFISLRLCCISRRNGFEKKKIHVENKEIPPANVPYVLIGTGLLWFGWFGFNAGSAVGATPLAVSAFGTTTYSCCCCRSCLDVL